MDEVIALHISNLSICWEDIPAFASEKEEDVVPGGNMHQLTIAKKIGSFR